MYLKRHVVFIKLGIYCISTCLKWFLRKYHLYSSYNAFCYIFLRDISSREFWATICKHDRCFQIRRAKRISFQLMLKWITRTNTQQWILNYQRSIDQFSLSCLFSYTFADHHASCFICVLFPSFKCLFFRICNENVALKDVSLVL